MLNADIALIGRYESDATFTYLATVGAHLRMSGVPHRQVLGGNNMATKILHSSHSESMTYGVATAPIAAYARKLGIHSAVGTPIVIEGACLGSDVCRLDGRR